MTEQEKALVKRDLALCLKLNTKLGDYQNINAVQKVYDWIGKEPRFHTVIGKRYVKRLKEVLEGETDFADCVLCNGFMMDGTAICPECLQKYRSLIPQPVEQTGQGENDTVQKMAAISRQAANKAKQMSATAKDSFNTVSEKISEFTEDNETLSIAKDKLRGIADSGMEKLQTNPDVAKVMEKGQEQAQKARGKWRKMSKKKRIVIVAVCVLLLFGVIGNLGGEKIESSEDAEKLLRQTIYSGAGYDFIYTGEVYGEETEWYFNLQVGENTSDTQAVTAARKQKTHDDFTASHFYVFKDNNSIGSCMVSVDGRIVVYGDGVYIRVQ